MLKKFAIEHGAYVSAKMDYSYSRRAQSVTKTLKWTQVAVIEGDSIPEILAESQRWVSAYASSYPLRNDRWRIHPFAGSGGEESIIEFSLL